MSSQHFVYTQENEIAKGRSAEKKLYFNPYFIIEYLGEIFNKPNAFILMAILLLLLKNAGHVSQWGRGQPLYHSWTSKPYLLSKERLNSRSGNDWFPNSHLDSRGTLPFGEWPPLPFLIWGSRDGNEKRVHIFQLESKWDPKYFYPPSGTAEAQKTAANSRLRGCFSNYGSELEESKIEFPTLAKTCLFWAWKHLKDYLLIAS